MRQLIRYETNDPTTVKLTEWLEVVPEVYRERVLEILNSLTVEFIYGGPRRFATQSTLDDFVHTLHDKIWRELWPESVEPAEVTRGA
jgi:hypothetical protein